jgi:putative endonuclease
MGEQLVKKKLQNKGWTFLTQNYHTRYGEIDLIFQDKQNIVFVEVKARSNLDAGFPEEAIIPSKLSKLKKAAQFYLIENSQFENFQPRIDAACLYKDENQKLQYNYYENITT